MSRCVIQLQHLGRFGNTMFGMAHALAYAEKWGCELQCDPWVGFKIFSLDWNPIRGPVLPRRDDHNLINGETNVSLRGYFQNSRSALYNQEQIRRWFRFKPDVEAALQALAPQEDEVLCHVRRGDYAGYGYPLVSRDSYAKACMEFGIPTILRTVSEEEPAAHPDFTGELSFVPDFFRMAKAKTLLRANSSFSFWAGAIVEAHGGKVFAPVIDGLNGGIEHDCRFVEGNGAARCADFDFVNPIVIPPAP